MKLSDRFAEALVGAGVLVAAGLFAWMVYAQTDIGQVRGGYVLTARFPSAVGVNVGTDVRVSGLKVGAVIAQDLDPKTYQAVVRFSVRQGLDLPVDTSAKIASEGLLGGSYLELSPGGAEEMLQPRDEIELTQGSVDLMGLIGRAIYSSGGAKDAPTPAPAPAEAP